MPRQDPPGQGDRSLRANGRTYRDRNGESKLLVDRLEKATASVIGIAGARGTGKSSLAQCVLGRRAEAGAFTQIIHAPTSYEPADFLVAVSQRICEGVIADVDRTLRRGDSVSARGKAALWGIVVRRLGVVVVGLALLGMAPTVVYWREGALSTLFETIVVTAMSGAVVVVGGGLLLWAVQGLLRIPMDLQGRLKVGLRSLAVEFFRAFAVPKHTVFWGAHRSVRLGIEHWSELV